MLKPSANPGVITYPLKLNSLITLPQDYSDLINSISGFTCPKVKLLFKSDIKAICISVDYMIDIINFIKNFFQ